MRRRAGVEMIGVGGSDWREVGPLAVGEEGDGREKGAEMEASREARRRWVFSLDPNEGRVPRPSTEDGGGVVER